MKLSKLLPTSLSPKHLIAQWRLNKIKPPSKEITEKKRISFQLQEAPQFRVSLGLDNLRLAVERASDPEHPVRADVIEIFERIYKDPHLQSQIENINEKVGGSPFTVLDSNKQPDEDRAELFERNWFEDLCNMHTEVDFWKHTLAEIRQMVPSSNELVDYEISEIEVFPRKHVVPEKGLIVLDPYTYTTGIPYRESPWNYWLIELGKTKGLGKAESASTEVIIKNFARTDLCQHSESYGKPILAVGTDTDDKEYLDDLEDNAQNLGSKGYYIGKKEDKVELLSEKGSGQPHLIYMENIKYSDESNSKLITGQTGVSDEQGWVGGVEAGERMLNERVESKMRRFQRWVNEKLFPKLIQLGYPLQGCKFCFLAFIKEEEENKGDQEPNDPNNPNPANGPTDDPAGK